MFHLEAIRTISRNLRDSYAEAKSGVPGSGREGMALGQYIAGMGFSNVGLGIDHAMAHTLSAHYDTPHGVACAMLLPIAMEYNKPVVTERLADVAVAMGVDTTGMSVDEAADAAIAAVRQLSADVNIPKTCDGLVEADLDQLASDALADACYPGNPREADHETVKELFRKIMA
jgi:lactaldehyde reductase